MKRITLLAVLLCMPILGFSQITFESAAGYGKLIDVTYDATVENKLYAATHGNHLVVSYDNAATWDLYYSYPGSAWIQDLKLAPGNQRLTFTTGTALQFFDIATQTITQSVQVPQSGVADADPSYYVSYSVFDAAGQIILANTNFQVGLDTFGKTFYSTNGGASWLEIYYTLNHDNVFVENVAISPANPQKLFLARGNGDSDIDGGLWISNDGGQTWTVKIAGIPVDAIAFNPSNNQEILVGTGISFGEYPENLYRSTDNGETWVIIPMTWSDQSLNNITQIVYNPLNVNKIILLEENEIALSTDGGTTWTNTVYEAGIADDYYFGIKASYNPFNENQVAITTDIYPQMSNDGGATLTQIHAIYRNTISVAVASYGPNKHLYYGANGGRFHKDLTTSVTDSYALTSVHSFTVKKNFMVADPVIPGRVFTYAASGAFGGWLSVSNDYAATTTNLMQAFGDDMQELTIDPNNSNIIYVAMRMGEDGTLHKIDLSDLTNVIVTEIATPQVTEMNNGVVTGVVIDPANSNIIYIAKRTKIFKSANGGLTWVEKTNGLDAILDIDLIWDMQVNPLNPQEMSIASNVGIFRTTDSCETWTQILPDVDVRRIKYSPINNGVIVGSVFANSTDLTSIVYTTDGGTTWAAVTSAMLNYVQSYAMDYLFEGNSIYAFLATSDLGVIRYDITNLSLGVHDQVAQNPVRLYPNPASSTVTIYSDDNIDTLSINVFSITGQSVLESNGNVIDVSGLSNGIYIVKSKDVNGKTYVSKLIKK